MIVIYSDRLPAYEYCPARYLLERPKSSRKVTNRFQALRMVFKVYFKSLYSQTEGINNYTATSNIINKYSDVLFGNSRSTTTEVMLAFSLKSFQKITLLMDKANAFYTPATMKFPLEGFGKHSQIRISPDLIFMNYEVFGRDSICLPVVNFVFLVDNVYWDEVSISNRLEDYLVYKYIWPYMKKVSEDSRYNILYFNPDSGQVLNSNYVNKNQKSTAYKHRFNECVDGILKGKFRRRTVGALCSNCPVYSTCNPKVIKEFKSFNELPNLSKAL